MKSFINHLAILLLIILFSSSCEKEIVGTNLSLPALIQSGAGTFGCLVDGQVYIPKAATPNPTIRKSIQNNILSVVAYKATTREGIVFLVRDFNELESMTFLWKMRHVVNWTYWILYLYKDL